MVEGGIPNSDPVEGVYALRHRNGMGQPSALALRQMDDSVRDRPAHVRRGWSLQMVLPMGFERS